MKSIIFFALGLFVVDAAIFSAVSSEKSPLLFAHRGNSAEVPENTFEAFHSAFDLGADVVEMDVHLSSDNVVMVIHDFTVDRTTDGKGEVNTFTVEELQSLDAGYKFTRDSGQTYPFRDQGLFIPTLAEVFAEFPDKYFNIDLKSEDPAAVDIFASTVRACGAEHRVIIGSFAETTSRKLKEALPDSRTYAGTVEAAEFATWYALGRMEYYNPISDLLELPDIDFPDTAGAISEANAKGQGVVWWTVNDVDSMTRLLDAGSDGIITDYVREAAAVFSSHKRANHAAPIVD